MKTDKKKLEIKLDWNYLRWNSFYPKAATKMNKIINHLQWGLYGENYAWGLECVSREIENNMWVHGDMEFLFKCSTQHLTSELSKWLRDQVEHKKIL